MHRFTEYMFARAIPMYDNKSYLGPKQPLLKKC